MGVGAGGAGVSGVDGGMFCPSAVIVPGYPVWAWGYAHWTTWWSPSRLIEEGIPAPGKSARLAGKLGAGGAAGAAGALEAGGTEEVPGSEGALGVSPGNELAEVSDGEDSGIAEPSPIRHRTVPTSTVSSSSTKISDKTPEIGEGTSESTLSVETSSKGSSTATWSPTFFSQRETVPSVTDSPRAGISMSCAIIINLSGL